MELVSVNISQMFFSAGVRSIFVTVLFVLAVYAVVSFLIKDEYKSALLGAWFMLFFFAYGHVYGVVEGMDLGGVIVGRHRFLFPIWLVLFGVGGVWMVRRSWNLKLPSRIFNLVSLVLLIIPVVQIGVFEWQRARSVPDEGGMISMDTSPGVASVPMDQLPDVYYIILDGYPRQDMVLQYHDFDNGDFTRQLESLGFYVPPCSQSNYAMTTLSLASSLNMDYLEGISANIHSIDFPDSIIHSRTRQFFEDLGYKTVSFESGIWFTEFHDADTFIDQDRPIFGSFFDFTRLSEFEIMFVRTTVLRIVEESKAAWLDSLFQNPRKDIYNRILFEFDQLRDSPTLPGPKFVSIHILAPHSTGLIFGADGSFEISSFVDPALGNELQYLNKRTLEAVQAILAGSKNPPIIILQSDHGLDPENRMAILNAFHFPDDGSSVLYPTITPVNTFRLVLNTYFGQDFQLLPDLSYYSSYEDMFAFTQVQYSCTP